MGIESDGLELTAAAPPSVEIEALVDALIDECGNCAVAVIENRGDTKALGSINAGLKLGDKAKELRAAIRTHARALEEANERVAFEKESHQRTSLVAIEKQDKIAALETQLAAAEQERDAERRYKERANMLLGIANASAYAATAEAAKLREKAEAFDELMEPEHLGQTIRHAIQVCDWPKVKDAALQQEVAE
jgi:hypothetical protein